jgi:hypothetical protein
MKKSEAMKIKREDINEKIVLMNMSGLKGKIWSNFLATRKVRC